MARAQTLLCLLALSAVALSGCGDRGGNGGSDDLSLPPVDDDTGLIRGVVVNTAVQPIVGATVTLLLQGDVEKPTAQTGEDGSFVFGGLAPGPYFLEAKKPGYKTGRTNTDVVAGVAEPDVVSILLDNDPLGAPYLQEFAFEGFLECAAGVAVAEDFYAFLSACSENGITPPIGTDKFSVQYPLDRTPTFAQNELVWDSTQPATQSLSTSWSQPGTDDKYQTAWGQSPIIMSGNETLFKGAGIGNETDLYTRVFPWVDQMPGAGVTLQQEFTIYTHVFYGFEPPTGWTFGKDGTPEVPR